MKKYDTLIATYILSFININTSFSSFVIMNIQVFLIYLHFYLILNEIIPHTEYIGSMAGHG